jgi:sulfoquinovosidase
MRIEKDVNTFKLYITENKKEYLLLEHTKDNPLLYVGNGEETIDMYRGNFKIEDYIIKRYPLKLTEVNKIDGNIILNFNNEIVAEVNLKDDLFIINFTQKNNKINRFWIRIASNASEKCYGCGEQMSYFNLRKRNFPIWTSEPGVGRDKSTYTTWRSDVENKAGGDYYNTNFPQPTFVSSKHYYLHVDSTAYSNFNFKNDDFHEIEIWEVPKQIRIEKAPDFVALVKKLSNFFGRAPELPDWVYNGLILGVQGGAERSFDLLEKVLDKNIKVSSLWCQDWVGKRITSFGKRLQWNWKYNKDMYPELPDKIKQLKNRNIRFLGYINPYLVEDGELYQEGKENGYFATMNDGNEYLVDFGEFNCGVVDLTNPQAYDWFKNIIKEHSLGIGLDGWMADFGEYLPVGDINLHNGKSPMVEHNHWPVLWAKCNYDALCEESKLSEAFYFMRAGGAGTQKYCNLLWAGDQSVDFSIHDGLASVICGSLSAGIMGCGLSHSDIGGYTSLFDNIRTKELFLRWAEMAVFTPVMRTHEGNRPETNFQFYDDDDTMLKLARLTDIYTMLAPYTKKLVKEYANTGLPVQRPLFMHYEDDEETYDIQYQYLFGRDMLIAPVYLSEKSDWDLYLPNDKWVHLWSGEKYSQGHHTVSAKMGYAPAFYREDSEYNELFKRIQLKYGVESGNNE